MSLKISAMLMVLLGSMGTTGTVKNETSQSKIAADIAVPYFPKIDRNHKPSACEIKTATRLPTCFEWADFKCYAHSQQGSNPDSFAYLACFRKEYKSCEDGRKKTGSEFGGSS